MDHAQLRAQQQQRGGDIDDTTSFILWSIMIIITLQFNLLYKYTEYFKLSYYVVHFLNLFLYLVLKRLF